MGVTAKVTSRTTCDAGSRVLNQGVYALIDRDDSAAHSTLRKIPVGVGDELNLFIAQFGYGSGHFFRKMHYVSL
jgi:hypothetical protein